MATLTKTTGTVTLSGAVEKVTFPAVYGWVWIKNLSDSDMFVGLSEGISAGADGVLSIPSGDAGRIQTDGQDSVYLLGSGNALVVAQNYADCPFKSGAKGGGADVGGESSYTLKNAVDYPLIGINLYGKSTQDGVPTPENPVEIVSVGDSGSVAVQSCGKNLIDIAKNRYTAQTNLTGEVLSNSTIDSYRRFNFIVKSSDWNAMKQYLYELIESVGKYAFTFALTKKDTLYFKHNGGTKDIRLFSITLNAGVYVISFTCDGIDTSTVNGLKLSNIQITKGDTATAYEPYHGATANITSALPLCGIPVESGGNYTDGNGQQWACDELIYNADGSGKIVKCTDKIDSYTGESITTPYISTRGSLTTGATVIYQLAEPQEIALTAAEMTALRELQTYSGITNISNDGGADMDVYFCTNKTLSEYVAPITTGLQAQIDELKAAILSMGGNV